MPVICGMVFFPMLYLLLTGVDLHCITCNAKRVQGRGVWGFRLIHLETSTLPVGDSHTQASKADWKADALRPHYSPNHQSGSPHNSDPESRPLGSADWRGKSKLWTRCQGEHSACSIGGQNVQVCISLHLYTNDHCANNKQSLYIETGLFWADVSLVIPHLVRH